ncbi:MAG: PQQ-dependent sugar dehydrogenase [Alteraurantiacibacter sp.]
MIGRGSIAASLALALLATPALAQQAPPPGVTPPPLQASYVLDTAEQHGVAVTVVARGMARSFALAFLPDGDLLVAERSGNLRLVRGATGAMPELVAQPITGMPLPSATNRSFGLNDVSVDPQFATTGLVYWTWNTVVPNAADPAQPPEQGRFTVMLGRLSGTALTQVETVFAAEQPAFPGGARVDLDGTGHLWATTGAPFGPDGQDLASPYGKVLRLNADGSVPADNPFAGRAGVHPAIYSYGHRDQHALALLPDGEVLTAEHGPNGGDELNLIAAGANYGWPIATLGRNYDGSDMPAPMQATGVTDPLVAWLPSIAPSGMIVYAGDAFPAWRGNVFVGSGRRGEIANTGGLERVVFNAEWGELRRETLLTQLHQRVRDVAQGPDGMIYVLIDGPDTAVLRLSPAPLPAPAG